MLVFSRRAGETFVLYPAPDLDPNLTVAELFAHGPIEISVLDVRPHQARVGIEAPPALLVYRTELLPLTHSPSRPLAAAGEA